MTTTRARPDAVKWAFKLHEAAAELRLAPSDTPANIRLASRLERYAEAILRPHLPRWWVETARQDVAGAGDGG